MVLWSDAMADVQLRLFALKMAVDAVVEERNLFQCNAEGVPSRFEAWASKAWADVKRPGTVVGGWAE